MTDEPDLVTLIELGLATRDQDKPRRGSNMCSACGTVGHTRSKCKVFPVRRKR